MDSIDKSNDSSYHNNSNSPSIHVEVHNLEASDCEEIQDEDGSEHEDEAQSCSGYGYDNFKQDEFYSNMPDVKWLLYPDDYYKEDQTNNQNPQN